MLSSDYICGIARNVGVVSPSAEFGARAENGMNMEYSTEVRRNPTEIIKIVKRDPDGRQIARASLVLIVNEINPRPYGLLEDVYVEDEHRGQGHATELVGMVVQLAKNERCYKLIATSRHSRPAVHALYLRLGFRDHGKEFRMDLTP